MRNPFSSKTPFVTVFESNFPFADETITTGKFELLREQLNSAVKNGAEIRAVFDINLTLCEMSRGDIIFFDDVLKNLTKLLKIAPVVCISGDQATVIEDQFIKGIKKYLDDKKVPISEQKIIFSNLTIYAETGGKKITFEGLSPVPPTDQKFAQLTKEEINIINEHILPQIIDEFEGDSRFELLDHKNLRKIARPLTIQKPENDQMGSIEFSIFGIHTGEYKMILRQLVRNSYKLNLLKTEIYDFTTKVINRFNKEDKDKKLSKVIAQLSGIGTLDFRTCTKADITFYHNLKAGLYDPDPIPEVLLVGVGDSFSESGNDYHLREACSITVDVNHHPKRTGKILELILEATKNSNKKRA